MMNKLIIRLSDLNFLKLLWIFWESMFASFLPKKLLKHSSFLDDSFTELSFFFNDKTRVIVRIFLINKKSLLIRQYKI
jgi:hypothetical protein